MRFDSGDPRLHKKRKARLVELAGGLHSDEDVLQLQFGPGDMCPSRGRAPPAPAAAVSGRVVRVLGRCWSLLDGAVKRAGRRAVNHAGFGRAAGA